MQNRVQLTDHLYGAIKTVVESKIGESNKDMGVVRAR